MQSPQDGTSPGRFPTSYYPYQNVVNQHLLPPNMSSPSSQGSASTPPNDYHGYSAPSGSKASKRSSSSLAPDNKKRVKQDYADDESASPPAIKDEKIKSTRGSRACTVCRRLKMKCVGAEAGPPCKRCQSGHHECIFEESHRGKRPANSGKKHEQLSQSVRKMERTLDTVLRTLNNPDITSGMVSRTPTPPIPPASASSNSPLLLSRQPPRPVPGSPKLHSLPDNSLNPLGLLAEASLANRRVQAAAAASSTQPEQPRGSEEKKLGVASGTYFKPGPMTILPLRRLYIERQIQPEMLSFVDTNEVVLLFNIYFENMNLHCNLLDRSFHSPSLVCSRSPFLLTAICAIASRFYTPKPDLHGRLCELAKNLAFRVPALGFKSVEIVQAYLLLTLFGCGAVERFELDTTWLMLGMAIRMATDLNLHRKTAVSSQDTPEGRARDNEVQNRERTWILCYCLDRSASAQMGKPHSIKEDFIIRSVSDWYKSPRAIPSDAGLAAYAELQRILSRSLDFLYSGTVTPSGLQVDCDYLVVIKTIEAQITAWYQSWFRYESSHGAIDHNRQYLKVFAEFYYNYSMLVVNSFGLQNALERSPVDLGHFFARCHSCAMTCSMLVRDKIAPLGYLKYSPDSHFVMISYAVLSLLKLVRPEFQAFLDHEEKTFALVKDVADTLEGIAVNPHHTPALYSSFLRALISVREPSTHSSLAQTPSSPMLSSNPVNGNPSDANAAFDAFAPAPGSSNDPFAQFQFESEMGPVSADLNLSTFPPTMGSMDAQAQDNSASKMFMDNILSNGFWDSVLMPGYTNTMGGLSGGFVFGAGGSGLITPGWGQSPNQSGINSPSRGDRPTSGFTQQNLNAAFHNQEAIGQSNGF